MHIKNQYLPDNLESILYRVGNESGFTLIEIIMIIAIIGILTAISLASYQNYLIKSKLAVAFSDVNTYRLPYEVLVNKSTGVSEFSPLGLNRTLETRNCQFSVTSVASSGNTIDAVKCSIINMPALSGEYIGLDRTQSGKWLCTHSAGIDSGLLPSSC